jgi:hypothetical protein
MIDRNTTPIESQLAAVSPATLSGLVCQALGGQGWDALRWRHTRIHLSAGAATGGSYRLAGTAERGSQPRDWSVILKVVVPLAGMTPEQNEVQTHPIYWKREVLAYQSGWLDHLPGGLRAPRCLGVEPQPDGSVWLWLEDVRDRYGVQWPIAQYTRAARCLGRFNGAYFAGQPWPPYDWLSRTNAEPRGVIDAYGWVESLVCDPATWDHPLLRETFAPALVARLPELWTNRHKLLDALDRLPQTVCHQDAWRANLLASPGGADDELVLIDWAVVGRSVLGSDLADLAVAGHGMLPVNISPADIDAAVFDAYLGGLRETGWPADRNLTRFAYATFAALKYGCLLVWLRDVPNEQRHGFWERVSGQRMDVMLGQQAVMLEHLLGLLDEARGLLEVI